MAAPVTALGVIGAANVDLTVVCDALPERGATVLGGDLLRSPGGKGANQAAAAAALGAAASLVGTVGPDENGRYLLAALAVAGVGVSRVTVGVRPTGVALILVESGGENVIVVSPGANADLAVSGSALAGFDGVLVQLETDPSLVGVALDHGAPVFLNASPPRPVPLAELSRCAAVVVNEGEARAYDLARIERCVITRGARGAVWLRHGNEVASAAAPPILAVDTVGAGDVFCAALAVRVLAGDPPRTALSYAVTAGSLATRGPGAQGSLPTDEEVRSWLERAS